MLLKKHSGTAESLARSEIGRSPRGRRGRVNGVQEERKEGTEGFLRVKEVWSEHLPCEDRGGLRTPFTLTWGSGQSRAVFKVGVVNQYSLFSHEKLRAR